MSGPETGYVGQKFYAPGFRVMRLAQSLTDTTGTELPKDVAFDILSVKVTQINTGPSTYEIVLNNAFTGTGRDRAGAAAPSSGAGGGGTTGTKSEGAAPQAPGGFERERLNRSSPVWPRYKYHDLAFFEYGQRLRIDMRYLPAVGEHSEPERQVLRDEWTPMIAGPITDIKFDLVAGAEERGTRITVSGTDDLVRLKDPVTRGEAENTLRAEVATARHLIERAGINLDFVSGNLGVEVPSFVTDDEHGTAIAQDAHKNPFTYLTELAKRIDYELFIEFDLVTAGRPLKVHFEPYRGRATPTHPSRLLIPLEHGKTLITLSATVNVAPQPSSVTISARDSDNAPVGEALGVADPLRLRDELQKVAENLGDIQPAPLVRQHYFPNRPNPLEPPNAAALTQAQADVRAMALLRAKARELCVIRGDTIGIPRMRAGSHVRLSGLRPPFDGYYYLTQTVHTINAQGYRTSIIASRPGIEIPSDTHTFVEPT